MPTSRQQIEFDVLRAQTGDRAGFEALVERCHPALVRHCDRHLHDVDLARDAAQEAWCAIVRALPRLDDPARFLAWALRIAGRRAIDLARRRSRDARLTSDYAATGGGDAAQPADDEHDDESGRLRDAVVQLDFDHRVVVELHYRDGLSLPEIADALELPIGTVKSRAFYARQRLRAQLERAVRDSDTEFPQPRGVQDERV